MATGQETEEVKALHESSSYDPRLDPADGFLGAMRQRRLPQTGVRRHQDIDRQVQHTRRRGQRQTRQWAATQAGRGNYHFLLVNILPQASQKDLNIENGTSVFACAYCRLRAARRGFLEVCLGSRVLNKPLRACGQVK